ncbi:amidohydrolase family protein [Terracidiphilus gabretensis]|uniref:amidohydrolase family protein n=1 Tax=Terracidiphilus gabretensis TaxID=1577687 RepID=UPI00071B1538|nr:amidohydrolase family protein [Terracidiphilus gabretensis]
MTVFVRKFATGIISTAVFALGSLSARSQNTPADVPPVIDVHVHAMDESWPGGPTCPNTSGFTASDPKTKEGPVGWVQEECTPKLYPSAKGEYMKDVIAEMKRLNVTAVVFGDPASVQKWRDAAPDRVIPGTSFDKDDGSDSKRVDIDELRKDFTTGGFKVMGEIGLQYEGISPSDPSVDKYFALAEELDIPIAIHMGTGGSGRANVTTPKFRGSMGNPLLLEELLARHPKLRVQVMHAGYPMIDNMLTLLGANSHVYVDVAGLIWSYPPKEVNRYIERLVDAGFEDRVMFGTDQMQWPRLMAYSISFIQNADYLTPPQKRDILYNNAARFLRLDTKSKAN